MIGDSSMIVLPTVFRQVLKDALVVVVFVAWLFVSLCLSLSVVLVRAILHTGRTIVLYELQVPVSYGYERVEKKKSNSR